MGEHFDVARVALKEANELSTRLGGAGTLDGRGQILWSTNFENGLNEVRSVGNNAYEVIPSNDYVLSGSAGCRLTTDVAVLDYAQISKKLGLPNWSKFGMEISVLLRALIAVWSIDLQLTLTLEVRWDGVLLQARIMYQPALQTLFIWDGTAGAWVALDAGITFTPTDFFATFKMVFDPAIQKYSRVLFETKEYFVENYAVASFGGGVERNLEAYVRVTNVGGVLPCRVHADRFVITYNEPSS